MNRMRGFRLGHKLVKVLKLVTHTRRPIPFQHCLTKPKCTTKAVSKLCSWARSLKLFFSKPNLHYIRVGKDLVETKRVSVPKGHLAVYVGEEENESQRVLVPLVYLHHPLFGELLREAEKVYGFNHLGVIKIPCRKSDFENLQTKIAACGASGTRLRRSWSRRFWS